MASANASKSTVYASISKNDSHLTMNPGPISQKIESCRDFAQILQGFESITDADGRTGACYKGIVKGWGAERMGKSKGLRGENVFSTIGHS